MNEIYNEMKQKREIKRVIMRKKEQKNKSVELNGQTLQMSEFHHDII